MKVDGSHAVARSPTPARKIQGRIAWILWGVLFLAAWTVIAVSPDRHPVNESYADGARAWAKRQPLYVGGGTLFIYAPQSALLHQPFLLLPKLLYEFVWRFTTIGLLAAGVYRLAQCCGRGGESNDAHPPIPGPSPARGEGRRNALLIGPLFLFTTVLVLPKTWTVAINGQATPAMAGLLLLALADFAERRWWRSAAALLLALAFKPLAIVLILLLGALSWRLGWRLVVASALFVGIPYLLTDPAYVTGQYDAFLGNLNAAAVLGQAKEWPQLFSLLHLIGFDLGETGQTLLQVAGAAVTLVAAWSVLRRFAPAQGVVLLYSLAACYLLLLNPRTENNSYTLLMPVVAAMLARAWLIERNLSRIIFLGVVAAMLTLGFELTHVVTPSALFVWPCPLACLAFLGFVAFEIARSRGWDRFTLTKTASQVIQPTEFQCST